MFGVTSRFISPDRCCSSSFPPAPLAGSLTEFAVDWLPQNLMTQQNVRKADRSTGQIEPHSIHISYCISSLTGNITLPEESQCITQTANEFTVEKCYIKFCFKGATRGKSIWKVIRMSGVPPNRAESEYLACLKYEGQHKNKVVPHSRWDMVIIFTSFTIFWLC